MPRATTVFKFEYTRTDIPIRTCSGSMLICSLSFGRTVVGFSTRPLMIWFTGAWQASNKLSRTRSLPKSIASAWLELNCWKSQSTKDCSSRRPRSSISPQRGRMVRVRRFTGSSNWLSRSAQSSRRAGRTAAKRAWRQVATWDSCLSRVAAWFVTSGRRWLPSNNVPRVRICSAFWRDSCQLKAAMALISIWLIS